MVFIFLTVSDVSLFRIVALDPVDFITIDRVQKLHFLFDMYSSSAMVWFDVSRQGYDNMILEQDDRSGGKRVEVNHECRSEDGGWPEVERTFLQVVVHEVSSHCAAARSLVVPRVLGENQPTHRQHSS